jgi:hypothetical protein
MGVRAVEEKEQQQWKEDQRRPGAPQIEVLSHDELVGSTVETPSDERANPE